MPFALSHAFCSDLIVTDVRSTIVRITIETAAAELDKARARSKNGL
jgi:hypothetical protein